ncbi:9219_t:CDS:2 [Ambispora gerdemannii]|uniref:9219_t:CDS:1 n=1 Tax=Ambispora gerdemannii TaxID=144530 RepID=A0A9N9ANC4_9GLOM|nr:9219_t:CDS:2 [Ambispora gerdemannii]
MNQEKIINARNMQRQVIYNLKRFRKSKQCQGFHTSLSNCYESRGRYVPELSQIQVPNSSSARQGYFYREDRSIDNGRNRYEGPNLNQESSYQRSSRYPPKNWERPPEPSQNHVPNVNGSRQGDFNREDRNTDSGLSRREGTFLSQGYGDQKSSRYLSKDLECQPSNLDRYELSQNQVPNANSSRLGSLYTKDKSTNSSREALNLNQGLSIERNYTDDSPTYFGRVPEKPRSFDKTSDDNVEKPLSSSTSDRLKYLDRGLDSDQGNYSQRSLRNYTERSNAERPSSTSDRLKSLNRSLSLNRGNYNQISLGNYIERDDNGPDYIGHVHERPRSFDINSDYNARPSSASDRLKSLDQGLDLDQGNYNQRSLGDYTERGNAERLSSSDRLKSFKRSFDLDQGNYNQRSLGNYTERGNAERLSSTTSVKSLGRDLDLNRENYNQRNLGNYSERGDGGPTYFGRVSEKTRSYDNDSDYNSERPSYISDRSRSFDRPSSSSYSTGSLSNRDISNYEKPSRNFSDVNKEYPEYNNEQSGSFNSRYPRGDWGRQPSNFSTRDDSYTTYQQSRPTHDRTDKKSKRSGVLQQKPLSYEERIERLREATERKAYREKFAYRHEWPAIFTRLHGITDKKIMHLEKLVEDSAYRKEQKMVIVQNEINILNLVNQGFPIKSLLVHAPHKPKTKYEIQAPALDYVEKPDLIKAENYYILSIDMARKILGTAARPDRHEIFAEVPFPVVQMPEKKDLDRMLVLDSANEAIDLGLLIHSAKALGWKGSFMLRGTNDKFNDFVIRYSGFHSLTWPCIYGTFKELLDYLKENEMSLLTAWVAPKEILSQCASMHDSNLLFWKPQSNELYNGPLPSRIALFLTRESILPAVAESSMRVSLSTKADDNILNHVIDINSAGSIIMILDEDM